MFKRIPIRTKLALALFLPVLAIFGVSIYEVGQANREVEQVRADTDLAGAALGPESLIRTLQDERNDSALTAVGLRDSASLPTENLAESRAVVDAAAEEFRAALAESGPRAEQVYASALDSFETTTAELRETIDAAPGKPSLARLPLSNEMWDGYSQTIDRFIAANTRLTLLIEDQELRSAAQMLDLVSRQVEYLGDMVRTGIISSLGGADVAGTTKNDVIASISQFTANRDRIDLYATGSYREEAAGLDQNPAYESAIVLLQEYVETSKLDTTQIIEAVAERPTPNVETVAAAAADALTERSAELRADAESRQRTFVALSLLTLVAGLAFMILAARSITKPLLSLTRQADEMAGERLPAAVQQILDTPLGDDVVIPEVKPVVVKTRDEVQDVAVALNSVQRSALDLAVEQAVLRRNIADSFVNLGRRTQNLIGRQLDFITELERNETDPATLNNLFKLDHLATRARRNAESLVVLAGLVTPRTWTAPIAMSDVVRAALSEVEDYQRVDVRGIGDSTIPGRTAADLVHLLAELLENGLSFSPPGRPVEVHGRMTRHGYVLAVIDQGIGMSDEEIEQANDRLAGRESYTIAPSRYLGHYVAGNLAQRIGVRVALSESPTGGITAKIVVPPEVMDDVPALPTLASPPADAPAQAELADGETETAPFAPAVDDALADGDRSDDVLSVTGRAEAVPVTENGLHRRVRRPEPDTSEPGLAPPVEPAAEPAAEPASAPVEPVAPAEPVTTPTVPLTPLAPVAQASTNGSKPPLRRRSALWEPPAEPAPTPPAVTAPAEAAPAGTTANGLRKRVPGDQLAASSLGAPLIPRGGATAGNGNGNGNGTDTTNGNGTGDETGATAMFSLLSTFESGVQRGRSDLTRANPDDDDREA